MEKKTIGKFIAALRRANGITQKELGERLFVSDKTVSRWERDECTPDLSLIPTIAEIFDITTDELLRGERRSDEERSQTEHNGTEPSAKAERQFRLLLNKRKQDLQNRSMISIGLTLLGLLCLAVANFAFSEGLIGFCILSAFLLASEICQIWFTVAARIPTDDPEPPDSRIIAANTAFVKKAVGVSFFNLGALGYGLPTVTLINGADFGLAAESLLLYGALFCAAALLIGYVFYVLVIRNALIRRDLLILDERETAFDRARRCLLQKVLCVSLAIVALLTFGICILHARCSINTVEKRFDNCIDFQDYLDQTFEAFLAGIEAESEQFKQTTETVYNSAGEVLCEYRYFKPIYQSIRFSETDGLRDASFPVMVALQTDWNDLVDMTNGLISICLFLILSDCVIAIVLYCVKLRRVRTRQL